MSIHNWAKCVDGDYRYVKKRVGKNTKLRRKHEILWNAYYDEYLERFGLDKKFEKYLNLLRNKALLQCDFVITNDHFIRNEISIIDSKIDALDMHFGGGEKIEKTLIHIGKWVGYQLKMKETTVVEYYEIVEEYGEWANKTK